LCGWESCKSPPESEYQVCTPSRLMQLRKKRNKSKKEPVWDRGGARRPFVERGYPHKTYHHHPHIHI
jgi:hypothetical protein